MNKRTLVIVGISVLLLLLLVGFMSHRSGRYDWTERYNRGGVQPYNTSFVLEMLKRGMFEGKKVVEMNKTASVALPVSAGKKKAAYIFVGEMYHLSTSSADSLMQFVKDGGQAMIVAKSLPYELMDMLYHGSCEGKYAWEDCYSVEDTVCFCNFNHNKLKMSSDVQLNYRRKEKIHPYLWSAMDSTFFCNYEEGDVRGSFTALGYIRVKNYNHINFARLKYGDGVFYFNTTPMAFTNLSISRREGAEYATKALSALDTASMLYWDVLAAQRDYTQPDRRDDDRPNTPPQTPLKAVLENPELSWAWFILLALGGLYLAFRAKRRQNEIPILAPNTNTSLAFVDTISKLYLQQGNHKRLAEEKMILFLSHIRNRYKLNTKQSPEQLIPQLAQRSDIPTSHLTLIWSLYRDIETDITTDAAKLGNFHQLLAYFYKNAK